jgi:hypothetical protein
MASIEALKIEMTPDPSQRIARSIAMKDVIELVHRLGRERFYGALTLKFEAGQIVTLKKEQTLKLTDLSDKPRSSNHNAKTE